MGIINNRNFFLKNSKDLAKQLLGMHLVHKSVVGIVSGIITEVEAYEAYIDKSSHSFKGKTKRNESLFLEGGHIYLHKIHTQICMDIVAEAFNVPSSVLIRSLEPVKGIEIMRKNRNRQELKDLTAGPGKLTKALGIDMSHQGMDLCKKNSIIYLVDHKQASLNIVKTKRIGISKSKDLINRFYIKGNSFISK